MTLLRIRRVFENPWPRLAVFVLFALSLRYATFGDLSRHEDESFYFLVGQRMHDGLMLYVDVWDRKPWGLFLIYYAIAGISTSVLIYQIIACLFAAATAMVICEIVRPWSGTRGGVLAGLGYLLALGPFEGATGQTPDFYNPLIAGAALLLLRERDHLARQQVGWRTWCAMGLCGIALTIKQTTLFEAIFLGSYVLLALVRANATFTKLAGIAAGLCAVGALATVSIAGFYAFAGHWPEFWQAMVLSNLAKAQEEREAWNALSITIKALPLLILAALGLLSSKVESRARMFIAAWLGAAFVGFVSVPNFYGHYTLPLLVPLSVAAGFALGRIESWIVPTLGLVLYSLLWYNPADFASGRKRNSAIIAMTELIRRHDSGGGLLVFDGPIYLYATADKAFLSPLVFPHHLNHAIENNVSHLDTRAEIDRVLAARPGVVVLSRWPRNQPINAYSRARVLGYVRANCSLVKLVNLPEGPNISEIAVWGDCGRKPAR